MSFIDKFTANVTNAGKIVSQKVKNLSDASSLNSAMNTEKRNIQDTIEEIGRLYYERHKNDPNAEFSEQIASILTSEKHIAELRTEIELVRAREPELVPIPESPAKNSGQPSASQKDEVRKPQPVAEAWYTDGQVQNAEGSAPSHFCAYCGKPCTEGQIFCANCGKKL